MRMLLITQAAIDVTTTPYKRGSCPNPYHANNQYCLQIILLNVYCELLQRILGLGLAILMMGHIIYFPLKNLFLKVEIDITGFEVSKKFLGCLR